MAVYRWIHRWRFQGAIEKCQMPKRKHIKQYIKGPHQASGVSMSETLFNPFPGTPSFFSPPHGQNLYTINVSADVLRIITQMVDNPVFRNKVLKLLQS